MKRLPGRPRHLRGWVLVCASFALVVFTALELSARLRPPSHTRAEVYDERGNITTRDLDHPVLGYAPKAGRRFHWLGYAEGSKVLDFYYTINEDGLRISTSGRSANAEQCILFFGGSTPFGEGVADSETVPYLVAEAHVGEYKVYNFAYFYYGGHQMLATLENNLLDDVVACRPRYAIYFGFVAHAERARYKGVPYSQRRGPMYRLGEAGMPTLDVGAQALAKFVQMFRWSRVVGKLDRIVVSKFHNRTLSRYDLALYVAIVDRARHLLKKKYEGIEFHLIFWDEQEHWPSEYLVERFGDLGIKMHFIGEIFPDYDYQTMGYSLGPEYMINGVTWHMNREAYRRMADYISSKILDGRSGPTAWGCLRGVSEPDRQRAVCLRDPGRVEAGAGLVHARMEHEVSSPRHRR
jgi:hypothetical protein